MSRYFFTLRGFVITLLVIGFVMWIVSNPNGAGTTLAGMVNTIIGWGQSAVQAIVTFAQQVFQ